jgi:hypothetical protein
LRYRPRRTVFTSVSEGSYASVWSGTELIAYRAKCLRKLVWTAAVGSGFLVSLEHGDTEGSAITSRSQHDRRSGHDCSSKCSSQAVIGHCHNPWNTRDGGASAKSAKKTAPAGTLTGCPTRAGLSARVCWFCSTHCIPFLAVGGTAPACQQSVAGGCYSWSNAATIHLIVTAQFRLGVPHDRW